MEELSSEHWIQVPVIRKKWVAFLLPTLTQEAEHLIRDYSSVCNVLRDDLDLVILLPLPVKCKGYGHVPLFPVYAMLGE